MIVSLLNAAALTWLLWDVMAVIECHTVIRRSINVQVVTLLYSTLLYCLLGLGMKTVLTSQLISHIIGGDVLVHLCREVVAS